MNILSAIYAGQTGFLKAGQQLAQKASRLSNLSSSQESQERAAEDLAGMALDKAQAKASLSVTRVADQVLQEFVQNKVRR